MWTDELYLQWAFPKDASITSRQTPGAITTTMAV
jgi:hypothetical protein